MTQLELQRSKFEELEAIESAIAARLERNPGLFVGLTSGISRGILNSGKKRPAKEVMMQRLEIEQFLQRYKRVCMEVKEVIQAGKVRDEVGLLREKSVVDQKSIKTKTKTKKNDNNSNKQGTNGEGDVQYSFDIFDEKFEELRVSLSGNAKENQKASTVAAVFEIGSASYSPEDGPFTIRGQRDGAAASSLPDIPIAPEPSTANEQSSQSTGSKSVLSKFAANINIDSIFTLEEQYGKYIDLVSFHEQWLNLPGLRDQDRLSYLMYLNVFSRVGLKYQQDEMNPNGHLRRHSDQYVEYVAGLAKYMKEYVMKTQVLAGPERTIYKIEKVDFAREWESLLEKYIRKDVGSRENDSANSLFCEACNKTFAKDTVFKAHLTGKKHIKNAKKAGDNTSRSDKNHNGNNKNTYSDKLAREKELSLNEYVIRSLADLLEKQIKDTKLNVERKQALTNRERTEETKQLLETVNKQYFSDEDGEDGALNGSKHDADNGSDDEHDSAFNPLKLPLDVDGRPIPYWLWKLQGLDHEFDCEICGNFKYAGRKIYDRHFMEQRHIHGLKCLGVNFSIGTGGATGSSSGNMGAAARAGTPVAASSSEILLAFKGITKIEEAARLWERIKKDVRRDNYGSANVVEVEDDEGNVMSEKVYEDLKKQGLI